MKGTVLDFLKLAAQNPELARKLGVLAAEFDFEFVGDEVTDEDLASVSGGTDQYTADPKELDSLNLDTSYESSSKMIQTLSNILKKEQSTQDSLINNIK